MKNNLKVQRTHGSFLFPDSDIDGYESSIIQSDDCADLQRHIGAPIHDSDNSETDVAAASTGANGGKAETSGRAFGHSPSRGAVESGRKNGGSEDENSGSDDDRNFDIQVAAIAANRKRRNTGGSQDQERPDKRARASGASTDQDGDNSGFRWRESLEVSEPGLPPCPEDLSERAWVDLVFGKECQICSRTRNTGQTIVWGARIRGCPPCVRQRFGGRPGRKRELPHSVFKYIPTLNVTVGPPKEQGLRYHNTTIIRWKAEYSEQETEEAKKEWTNKIIELGKARQEHAKKCKEWASEREKRQAAQRAMEQQQRKELILGKLDDLGFGEDTERWLTDENFWKSYHVQPLLKKEITRRVWKNAEAKVVDVAERFRDNRIEREFGPRICARYELVVTLRERYAKTRPINEPIPSPADIFLSPEMYSLLADTPLTEDVTLEFFDGVAEQLPAISMRWVEETKKKLVEMCGEKGGEILLGTPGPADESFLELAVAVFGCKRCGQGLSYLQVLVHKCPRKSSYQSWEMPRQRDLRRFVDYTGWCPWNYEGVISFSEEMSKRAVELLKAGGYDYKTVKFERMDSLDDIFECKAELCSGYTKGRLMLTWRLAVEHECGNAQFKRVDARTAAIVKARMTENMVKQCVGIYDAELTCVHCRQMLKRKEVRQHLLSSHEIAEPKEDDVVELLDSRGIQPYHYHQFGGVTRF